MNDLRGKLLKYPKEVLVDYLLKHLLFDLDWKELDFGANQLKIRRLLNRTETLLKECKPAGFEEWKRLHDELDRIQKQVDRLNEAQNKLLGIEKKRLEVNRDTRSKQA